MALTKEELTELARQQALLGKSFETHARQLVKVIEQSIVQFNTITERNNIASGKLLEEASHTMKDAADKAIGQSTSEHFSGLSGKISSLCQQIDSSAVTINRSASKLGRQSRIQGWTVSGLSILMILSVLIFSSWYLNRTRQENVALRAQNNSIEYNSQVKKALNKVSFALCDGQLCLKIKKDMPRYGQEEEYIIVE